ncbi:MAG: hypothetical protein ACK6AD_08620 [Cyanobacteriota bacterium]
MAERITGTAADSLPQTCQFCRQGGELALQLLHLLLLGHDQLSGTGGRR